MTRALGIDIGSLSIKLAEINFDGKETEVLGLYRIPVLPDEDPTHKIKSFLSSQAINPERICVGLGNCPLVLKRVAYPFGDRKKVEAALLNELEDSIPFELDDFNLEFEKTGRTGKLHHYQVALCPKENVDLINKTFEGSQPPLSHLALDNEALARLALRHFPNTTGEKELAKNIVVCDIGFQVTKIAVIKQITGGLKKWANMSDHVLEMRNISKGSMEIYDWMSLNKKMDAASVEQWLAHRAQIKDTPGEGHPSDDTSDELKNALKPLIVEIYQTLQSLRGKLGVDLHQIVLTGGICNLKGFAEFVASELRIPSLIWHPLDALEVSPEKRSPDKETEFTLALAFAHRFSPLKAPPWLNFRRASLSNYKLLSSNVLRFGNDELRPHLIALLVAFVFFHAYSFVTSMTAGTKIAELKKELIVEFRELDSALGKRAASVGKDPSKARDLFEKEKERLSRNLSQSKRARSDFLLELSGNLPTKLKITDLKISDTKQGYMLKAFLAPDPLKAFGDTQQIQESITESLSQLGYDSIGWENKSAAEIHLTTKWQKGAK